MNVYLFLKCLQEFYGLSEVKKKDISDLSLQYLFVDAIINWCNWWLKPVWCNYIDYFTAYLSSFLCTYNENTISLSASCCIKLKEFYIKKTEKPLETKKKTSIFLNSFSHTFFVGCNWYRICVKRDKPKRLKQYKHGCSCRVLDNKLILKHNLTWEYCELFHG